MGRFDEIKNKINANINENGEQRITGQVLNEVLIDEVNTIDEAITELEESIGQGGSGGITEEKEVYIGENAPTDDGAKLWIDPTGTPSQPSDYATKEYVDNAIYNVLNSSF